MLSISNKPPPLAGKIMHKQLVAGILTNEPPTQTTQRAMDSIAQGVIQVKEMISHQFPYTEAKGAFDFLWHTPEKGLGVLLDWQIS